MSAPDWGRVHKRLRQPGRRRAWSRGPRLPARRAAGFLPGSSAFYRRAARCCPAGSNGSGKSEPVALLATLLAPAAGSLLWRRRASGARCRALSRRGSHYVGHLDATKPAITPALDGGLFWAALRGGACTGPSRCRRLPYSRLPRSPISPCRWLSAGQRRPRAGPPRRRAGAGLAARRADRRARCRWRRAPPRGPSPSIAPRGSQVALATHQPVALGGAAVIVLDDFAAPPEAAALAALW